MARGNRIRISVTITASKDAVWAELCQIDRHPRWMKDAVRIEFTSDQHQGVGTTFRCLTRVGPLRTWDQMEVTGWIEGSEIAVRHRGLVTGEGRFVLRGEMGRHCVVRWEEQLHFPWYVGGGLTARFARPILKSIWRRNLSRLQALVESPPS